MCLLGGTVFSVVKIHWAMLARYISLYTPHLFLLVRFLFVPHRFQTRESFDLLEIIEAMEVRIGSRNWKKCLVDPFSIFCSVNSVSVPLVEPLRKVGLWNYGDPPPNCSINFC